MYFKKVKHLIFALLLFTFACSATEQSSQVTDLAGHWMMQAVYQEGNDVTEEHNPERDRYITFREDGTFETGGSPWGKNTGKYIFNEADMRLFLDSDVGEEDDSNWIISFRNDTLHWQGVGTAWAEDFEILHVKK